MKLRLALLAAGPVLALALCGYSAHADHLKDLPPSARHQEEPIVLKQVAPDLYFHYHDASSNSAFLVTSEGVLVVDAGQHPADGRALLARIRTVTDKPIRYLINTHFHGDHVFGNPAFHAVGATIIAHHDTVTMMRTHFKTEITRRNDYYERNKLDPADVRLDVADLTIDGGAGGGMTITLGGRTVQIIHPGAGQNPGDLLVLFPHARTVFVGGPFARRNWSNTSFTPSVDGWIAVLQKVAAMDVDRFLPGHGDIGTRQDVLDEAQLLADFQAAMKAGIAQGLSRDELIKTLRFPKYQSLRNYDRLHNFIGGLHTLYTTGKPATALP